MDYGLQEASLDEFESSTLCTRHDKHALYLKACGKGKVEKSRVSQRGKLSSESKACQNSIKERERESPPPGTAHFALLCSNKSSKLQQTSANFSKLQQTPSLISEQLLSFLHTALRYVPVRSLLSLYVT
eukprot:scaffold94187_cov52-Attheya_sp.AAC.6